INNIFVVKCEGKEFLAKYGGSFLIFIFPGNIFAKIYKWWCSVSKLFSQILTIACSYPLARLFLMVSRID
ncbi:MAG TPA: hypothetical protein VKR58_07435, partial [Aquella sp.]|nr:hypothetical protein [Aquella sp.]